MHVFKLITPSYRTETRTEVTRVVIKDDINSGTLELLLERLKTLHGQSSGPFFLSWYDGTDHCTIRDVDDLKEAVAFFEESESKDKAVRLSALPDKTNHQSISSPHPEHNEEKAKELNKVKADTDVSEPEELVTEEVPAEDEENEDFKLAQALNAALNSSLSNEETENAAVPAVTAPVAPAPTDSAPDIPPSLLLGGLQYPQCPAYSYGPYGMQPPYPYFYGNVHTPIYPPFTPPMMPNKTDTTTPVSETATAPPADKRQSVPDLEMLGKISKLNPPEMKPQPRQPPTPAAAMTSHTPRKNCARMVEKEKRRQYVMKALGALRAMGYQQDERDLKRLIKKHNGNLNVIIDTLESQGK